MSVTIQQLISDAKRLAGRLKEREVLTDVLLTETQKVNKKIDEIKQYQDEVEVLNEVARHRPHSQLIASIQQENRILREIQQENRELRAALEDHQIALEHIMTKYRQHTDKQIWSNKIDYKILQNTTDKETIRKQSEKIDEMAAVMRKAACCDDSHMEKLEETLRRLLTENKGLREILEISCKFGSYGSSLVSPVMEDKDIQTDTNELDSGKAL